MSKSIRISDKVHDKLKVHVAKEKTNIIEFADEAILHAIKLSKQVKVGKGTANGVYNTDIPTLSRQKNYKL